MCMAKPLPCISELQRLEEIPGLFMGSDQAEQEDHHRKDQTKQMKEYAQSFYSSQAWKNIRSHVMQRDHYLCQDCMKKGHIVPAEEVHHIVEISPENINDTSVTLNPDNLVSLCRECHRSRHKTPIQRRYTVDAFGKVTIIE